MAPIFIPEIISVFLTMGIIGGVLALIFWGIRKVNRGFSSRKLRRKLSTATMSDSEK